MTLGENIHAFRMQSGMSQGDLAGALEVARQSVAEWENNTALPALDNLMRMGKLFGVTLDGLVYGSPEAAPAQTEDVIPQEPGASAMAQEIPSQALRSVPVRIPVGAMMLLVGMIFFLLSIFWGDHLASGEELGEFLSISTVLISIALLATHNHKVLASCAVVYMGYAVVCFGILNVVSLMNDLFLFLSGVVLFVWFLVWGTKASREETVPGN